MGDTPGQRAYLKNSTKQSRSSCRLEFPRPSNSTRGAHAVDIKIAYGYRYYVGATAVTARLLDESVIKDPTTVPSDPSRAPEQGKRRVLLR